MLEALLGRIARALDARQIPYMLIGGQAVLVHGEPRFTRDVDLALGVGPEHLPSLLALAKDANWCVLVDSPEEFVAQTLVLPCQDIASGIRVDMIFTFSPFERRAIDRARVVRVGDQDVRFAEVEDLIVLKVIAGRPRDLEDVHSILLKNPSCDAGYVRRWLRELQEGQEEDFVARFEGLRKLQK